MGPSRRELGKKPGFIDVDDEKFQKGKTQLIEESAKWKGPNHKQRSEEQRETKRVPKKAGRGEPDKASWKKQLVGGGVIIFLCGVGLISFISQMIDFARGSGVVNIDVLDTPKLKSVLFGGEPWLIYCVNNQTANQRLPKVLEESSGGLWSRLSLQVGVLHCWDQTASGRSVAQRFKLRTSPPLAFVVANGNSPRALGMTGIAKVEDLEKKVKPGLLLDSSRIDTLKKWPQHCTSRRSCVVIGHKNTAQRDYALTVLKPLLERHRAVKLVTLDTAFWQLKLEDSLLSTRKNKGAADVICLGREEPSGGGNATFGAFFLPDLDSSSAASFYKACADHTDLVKISVAPRIIARPSKPKKVTAAARPPPSSSKPAPPPPRKKSVDHVGSRASLESEDEPLFEAIDEEENKGEADGGDAAGEDEEEDSDDEVEL
ncbi:unnamed protein product [Polarella glacialis]|uniref:Uncharacterized protein n=1 Tax=Polarella glacialis TaxID=89957 RepID=A0A813CZR1_POLGL|nr:unnamed protein product [Polarella glacialis]